MKFFKTISTYLLALLVLVSSTSFTVGVHFCGDKVADVSIFSKPESCAKTMDLQSCHQHKKHSCCKDQIVVHEHDEFKGMSDQLLLNASPSVLPVQHIVFIAEVIPDSNISRTLELVYDPPIPTVDRVVTLGKFLI